MAAIKKGTKLTDNPKDYMLRVRLDSKTLERLDCICKKKSLSRSGVIRNLIDDKYQNNKK